MIWNLVRLQESQSGGSIPVAQRSCSRRTVVAFEAWLTARNSSAKCSFTQ